MSHIGESVPGYYFWDGTKLIPAAGGGTNDGSVETYPVATTTGGFTLYAGGGPTGDLILSLVLPSIMTDVTQMACVCNQAGAGLCRMAIYDSTGNKLAETATFSAVVGQLTASLLSPITLTEGVGYYLGLWTAANGAQFYSRSGLFTGSGITLNFEAVNVAGAGGLPASVAGSLSNKVATAAWIAAG